MRAHTHTCTQTRTHTYAHTHAYARTHCARDGLRQFFNVASDAPSLVPLSAYMLLCRISVAKNKSLQLIVLALCLSQQRDKKYTNSHTIEQSQVLNNYQANAHAHIQPLFQITDKNNVIASHIYVNRFEITAKIFHCCRFLKISTSTSHTDKHIPAAFALFLYSHLGLLRSHFRKLLVETAALLWPTGVQLGTNTQGIQCSCNTASLGSLSVPPPA